MKNAEAKATRQEVISGIVFFLFGLSIMYYSATKLNFGSYSKPGSGFIPMISGFGIALTSAVFVLTNIFHKLRSEPLWPEKCWITPLLALVLITFYALLFKPIGYVLATLVFMIVWQIILVREKWWKVILIAVPSTIGVYILFVMLLRVYIPKGPLGF